MNLISPINITYSISVIIQVMWLIQVVWNEFTFVMIVPELKNLFIYNWRYMYKRIIKFLKRTVLQYPEQRFA